PLETAPPEPAPASVVKPVPIPTDPSVRRSTDAIATAPHYVVFRYPPYEQIHVEGCPRLPDPQDPNYRKVVQGFTRIEEARNAPHVGEFCERCPVDRSGAPAPRPESAPPRNLKSARTKKR
ncbi:MAG TPA: hypothetical protein VGH33_05390, partial [Isosphaeraceae bacterium]